MPEPERCTRCGRTYDGEPCALTQIPWCEIEIIHCPGAACARKLFERPAREQEG